MDKTNNTENPQDDKTARMNKFFEEMNMKIEAEEKGIPPVEKPKTQVPPKRKSYIDELNDTKNKVDNLPPIPPLEEKQTFLEALQELKKELDPKADKLMDTTINKSKELFTKVESEAKNLFNRFDKYTDSLESKMKKREEEYERLKQERREKHNPADSLFESAGGLFDKAKKFMEGEEQKEQAKDGEIRIIQPNPKPKKPNPNDKVYGFEDLDGDGNPFIDDAIIEK
ncbi:MAG: hypothetical protein AB8G11_15085 [Saprospiraceae bacterium]